MVFASNVLLAINAASAFLTAIQLLQSLLVTDYRQALAFRGDSAAAKRIILPCYRPLFISLIFLYIFLSLFQGLSILFPNSDRRRHDESRFAFEIVRIYGMCILAVLSILPALFIQKSVSLRGFWRSFFAIFPWFSLCCSLLFIRITLDDLSYASILSIELIYLLLVSAPSLGLSISILSRKIKCRVQLGSSSNRNAIELLLIYSALYSIAIVIGIALISPTYPNQSNSFGFDILSIYFVTVTAVINSFFPFALFRGLLADTKFWRGLGRHNQGGLGSTAEWTVERTSSRPTASSIDLSVASSSFQQMMSDISSIALDFAYIQVDRCIGEGATSEVFCGRFNSKLVAIKVSTPPEVTVEVINVFAAEAKICAALSHKNIVKFYGICVRPPQIGMVFELCEGGNLKINLLKHNQKWTRAMRVRACLHATEAVAYIHSKGYIHRDLKAENFLVTRRMIVKLGDFGEAIRKRNEESTQQKRMSVLGTVTHMAPELIAAARYYTEAVDVYALAVTFLEILTGSDPYGDLNHFQIYKEVSDGNRPKLPEDCIDQLADMINAAWRQDYMTRPTANQMADELADLLSRMTGMVIRRELPETPPKKGSFDFVTEDIDITPAELPDPNRDDQFKLAKVILKLRARCRCRKSTSSPEESNDEEIRKLPSSSIEIPVKCGSTMNPIGEAVTMPVSRENSAEPPIDQIGIVIAKDE